MLSFSSQGCHEYNFFGITYIMEKLPGDRLVCYLLFSFIVGLLCRAAKFGEPMVDRSRLQSRFPGSTVLRLRTVEKTENMDGDQGLSKKLRIVVDAWSRGITSNRFIGS